MQKQKSFEYELNGMAMRKAARRLERKVLFKFSKGRFLERTCGGSNIFILYLFRMRSGVRRATAHETRDRQHPAKEKPKNEKRRKKNGKNIKIFSIR